MANCFAIMLQLITKFSELLVPKHLYGDKIAVTTQCSTSVQFVRKKPFKSKLNLHNFHILGSCHASRTTFALIQNRIVFQFSFLVSKGGINSVDGPQLESKTCLISKIRLCIKQIFKLKYFSSPGGKQWN